MAYDPEDDSGPPPATGQAWWQGPPPPGYSGPWPPPLPPGGSYGPNLGQIIYPTDAGGNPTTNQPSSPLPTPAPAPTPTPTPTAPPPSGGSAPPPAAAGDYDFNQARANIERAIGRPLSDADIAYAFQTWGGSPSSRFTDAGIAPVIAHFKGSGSGTPPPGSGNGAPTYQGPGYTPPPGFQAPPAFQYDDFQAPTANDLFDDPGYQLRLSQGGEALNRSAAARGVLNTGGTLKDILNFGQDLASQEYRGLYDRSFQTYSTNRNNAFENYKTNYGISADTYDRNYTTQYKDPFNFASQNAQGAYDSAIHNYDQNQYYASHNSDLDRMYAWNKLIQDYNAQRNTKLDDFDMRYRLLGLL